MRFYSTGIGIMTAVLTISTTFAYTDCVPPANGEFYTIQEFADAHDCLYDYITMECCCINNTVGSTWHHATGPYLTQDGCTCPSALPECECTHIQIPMSRDVDYYIEEDKLLPEYFQLNLPYTRQTKVVCDCDPGGNIQCILWQSNRVPIRLHPCVDC
jgi:hypothetical protein